MTNEHNDIAVDKEEIGRKVMHYSVLFVFFVTLIPMTFLFYNHYVENETIRIWWLTPSLSRPDIYLYSHNKMLKKRVDNYWPSWTLKHRLTNQKYDNLINLAFCSDEIVRSTTNDKVYFPFGSFMPAQTVLEPWIMDATITNKGSIVSIVVMEADTCLFDVNEWQEIVQYSRKYGNIKDSLSLGNGSLSSINVNYTKSVINTVSTDIIKHRLFISENFVNQRIMCRYYDKSSKLVTSVLSYPIIQGLLIRCPIPIEIRDSNQRLHMRLQIPHQVSSSYNDLLKDKMNNSDRFSHLKGSVNNGGSLHEKDYYLTSMFSVCPLPSFPAPQSAGPVVEIKANNLTLPTTNHLISPFENPIFLPSISDGSTPKLLNDASVDYFSMNHRETYDYNLSICMSTTSHSKIRIIEWIEYYRMIGVDHFFIYDRYRYNDPNKYLHHRQKHIKQREKSLKQNELNTGTSNSLSLDDDGDDDDGVDDESNDDDDDDDDDSIIDLVSKNYSDSTSPIYPVEITLYDILQDYVDYGLVTIVPWPYRDCMENFGNSCGDFPIHSQSSLQKMKRVRKRHQPKSKIDAASSEGTVFHPPPRLQRQVAMKSCYMRFQSVTKWMAILDDVDFIVMDPSYADFAKGQNIEGATASAVDSIIDPFVETKIVRSELVSSVLNISESLSATEDPTMKLFSLSKLISQLDSSYNNLAAVEFIPSVVIHCSTYHKFISSRDNLGDKSVNANKSIENEPIILDSYSDEESAASKPPRYSLNVPLASKVKVPNTTESNYINNGINQNQRTSEQMVMSLPSTMKKLILRTSYVTTFTENYVLTVEFPANRHHYNYHKSNLINDSRNKNKNINTAVGEIKTLRHKQQASQLSNISRSESGNNKESTLNLLQASDKYNESSKDFVRLSSTVDSHISRRLLDINSNVADIEDMKEIDIEIVPHNNQLRSSAVNSNSYDKSRHFWDNMFFPEIDKVEARRGDRNAKFDEYSIASLDSQYFRVLEYRKMDDNICNKAVLIDQSLEQVCNGIEAQIQQELTASLESAGENILENKSLINSVEDKLRYSYLTTRFISHNMEMLRQRYIHGLVGDILE